MSPSAHRSLEGLKAGSFNRRRSCEVTPTRPGPPNADNIVRLQLTLRPLNKHGARRPSTGRRERRQPVQRRHQCCVRHQCGDKIQLSEQAISLNGVERHVLLEKRQQVALIRAAYQHQPAKQSFGQPNFLARAMDTDLYIICIVLGLERDHHLFDPRNMRAGQRRDARSAVCFVRSCNLTMPFLSFKQKPGPFMRTGRENSGKLENG